MNGNTIDGLEAGQYEFENSHSHTGKEEMMDKNEIHSLMFQLNLIIARYFTRQKAKV